MKRFEFYITCSVADNIHKAVIELMLTTIGVKCNAGGRISHCMTAICYDVVLLHHDPMLFCHTDPTLFASL